MYNQNSIDALESRIGFGTMEIPVIVSPTNQVGDSGRFITWFHRLANLENIYETVNEVSMTEIDFNAYLEQMKLDAVKHVLSQVFDENTRQCFSKDYSQIIIDRIALFDEAIGYTMAVTALEQMVSTTRSNDEERNARRSYGNLKMELDGATDVNGNVVSKGIKHYQYHSIRNVINVLFPDPLTVNNQEW